MKRKELKKLIENSFTGEVLDKVKVNNIVKKLTRKELKEYIKAFKISEQKKVVEVYFPEAIKDRIIEESLKIKFPGKKIKFKKDKNLIAGIKIVDYDKVYDYTLKNKLDSMVNRIN